jgi:hypothetical protein
MITIVMMIAGNDTNALTFDLRADKTYSSHDGDPFSKIDTLIIGFHKMEFLIMSRHTLRS